MKFFKWDKRNLIFWNLFGLPRSLDLKLHPCKCQVRNILQYLNKYHFLGWELLACARMYFCTRVCKKASAMEICTFYRYFNQFHNVLDWSVLWLPIDEILVEGWNLCCTGFLEDHCTKVWSCTSKKFSALDTNCVITDIFSKFHSRLT